MEVMEINCTRAMLVIVIMDRVRNESMPGRCVSDSELSIGE
jgi:hypothetical protein